MADRNEPEYRPINPITEAFWHATPCQHHSDGRCAWMQCDDCLTGAIRSAHTVMDGDTSRAEVPEGPTTAGPTNERVRYALDAIYNTLDAYCKDVDEKSSIDEWMQTIRAACLQTAGPMPEVTEDMIADVRSAVLERKDVVGIWHDNAEKILALLEWAAGMKGGAK